jgi:hypothetical protein
MAAMPGLHGTLLAVDVKTTGQFVAGPHANRVVAVGVAWSRANAPARLASVSRRRWMLDLDGAVWEARSVREFWCAQPAAATQLLAEPSTAAPRVTEETFAREFAGFVQALAARECPPGTAPLVLLSDAPVFDLGWLDNVLCAHGHPTTQLLTNTWIPVVNTDSYVLGAADLKPACLGRLHGLGAHLAPHLPEDDAALALMTFMAVREEVTGHRAVADADADAGSDTDANYSSDVTQVLDGFGTPSSDARSEDVAEGSDCGGD